MEKRTKVVVVRASLLEHCTRSQRTVLALKASGYDVVYVGWDRYGTMSGAKSDACREYYMHTRRTLGPRSVVFLAAFWLFSARVIIKEKAEIIHCANEDVMLGLLPLKWFMGCRCVLDVYDPLHARMAGKVPGAAVGMAKLVAWLTHVYSDSVIIVSEWRRSLVSWKPERAVVVENGAEDPGFELAARQREGGPKVFLGGSLSVSRGLRQLLSAVERVDGAMIVAAGPIGDPWVADCFVRHPQVSYRGEVQVREVMELASGCDAAFAFYDPTGMNNRLASPSKLYDALAVGRAVIINRECLVHHVVVESDIGFVCDYDDVEGLAATLRMLPKTRGENSRWSYLRLRDEFASRFSWNRNQEVLINLYTSFDRRAGSAGAQAA